MPKITDTRKHRAAKLLRMLTDGPSFSDMMFCGEVFNPAEASRQFRNWSEHWILPVINQLVPELRRIATSAKKAS